MNYWIAFYDKEHLIEKTIFHIDCTSMSVFMHEFIYDVLNEINLKISYDKSHIRMVSLQCEFFYDELNYLIVKISLGIFHTHTVSFLYVIFYDLLN